MLIGPWPGPLSFVIRRIGVHALLITAAVIVAIPAILYLAWVVHCTLDRICLRHAQRFCDRSGLEICRVRWQPEFGESGFKTESTLVQLDCLDAQKQRKLVLLLVWPFGVRKLVSDEKYPESYDEQWPQPSA